MLFIDVTGSKVGPILAQVTAKLTFAVIMLSNLEWLKHFLTKIGSKCTCYILVYLTIFVF